ncbi:sorting nexin-15 isoform X2 [Spea bombifrons]|uniref:sorting nexin-15 isoform X2 n=1 Tax=Spea bombifrons TaxID=233779 RepID=UPI00234AE70F|nr:sorting nexin-15 isoform X2 [Spea bombifrons]
MSRGSRDQHERKYYVTETRTHPKGFTEYKFISKKNPHDVKEVVIWKRYSDFKKLHGELSYTHRNLFQRNQEFPAFPKAQVFGRFEAPVIEERRQAAEDMLKFTVNIPALNNSPQLKEFFRGGEVVARSDITDSVGTLVLPPPLTPEQVQSLSNEVKEGVDNASGDIVTQEVKEEAEDAVGGELSPFDLLFDISEDHVQLENERTKSEPESSPKHPLTFSDLALFDPCFMEERSLVESELDLCLLSLECEGEKPDSALTNDVEEGGAYVSEATLEIQKAMEKETAGDYPEAFRLYRNAVDTLLRGVKGDPCISRRDTVARRTSEYLRHAEMIFQEHMSRSPD